MTHVPTLTPLRGLAALLIVVYHFAGPELKSYSGILAGGYMAVDLFFMLSGFVLSHVYAAQFAERITLSSYTIFVRARCARVYPLHLATLMFLVWFISLGRWANDQEILPADGRYSVSTLWQNALLLHGLWSNGASWNYPSWSVGSEWYVYLLFPVLMMFAAHKRRALLLAALCLAGLGATYHAYGHLALWRGYGGQFFRCLFEFGLGMALYQLYASGFGRDVLSRVSIFAGAIIALLVALHFGARHAVAVPAFVLIILAGAHGTNRFVRLLNTSPFIWLGDISYSIYMVHAPVGIVAERFLSPAHNGLGPVFGSLYILALVGVTIMIAQMTYRRIELPARSLLRRRFAGDPER